jgi:hypothetical protein
MGSSQSSDCLPVRTSRWGGGRELQWRLEKLDAVLYLCRAVSSSLRFGSPRHSACLISSVTAGRSWRLRCRCMTGSWPVPYDRPNTRVWRDDPRPASGLPSDRHPIRTCGRARGRQGVAWQGMEYAERSASWFLVAEDDRMIVSGSTPRRRPGWCSALVLVIARTHADLTGR